MPRSVCKQKQHCPLNHPFVGKSQVSGLDTAPYEQLGWVHEFKVLFHIRFGEPRSANHPLRFSGNWVLEKRLNQRNIAIETPTFPGTLRQIEGVGADVEH